MPGSQEAERWAIIHVGQGGTHRHYRDERGGVTPHRTRAAKFLTRQAAVEFARSVDLSIGAQDYPGLEMFPLREPEKTSLRITR